MITVEKVRVFVIQFDLEQPSLPIRVGVDHFRVVGGGMVDIADGAVSRHDGMGDGLGGFQFDHFVPGSDLVPRFRQVDVDQVSQLSGRVGGDPQDGRADRRIQPDMVFRVKQVVGDVHIQLVDALSLFKSIGSPGFTDLVGFIDLVRFIGLVNLVDPARLVEVVHQIALIHGFSCHQSATSSVSSSPCFTASPCLLLHGRAGISLS